MNIRNASLAGITLGALPLVSPIKKARNRNLQQQTEINNFRAEKFAGELKDTFKLSENEIADITNRVKNGTQTSEFFRDSLLNVQKIKNQAFEQGKQFARDSVELARQGKVKL